MCDYVPIDVVVSKLNDQPIQDAIKEGCFTKDDILECIKKGQKCIHWVFVEYNSKARYVRKRIMFPKCESEHIAMTLTCPNGLKTLANNIMDHECKLAYVLKLHKVIRKDYTLDVLIYKVMTLIFLCLNQCHDAFWNVYEWRYFQNAMINEKLDLSQRTLNELTLHTKLVLLILREKDLDLLKYIKDFLYNKDDFKVQLSTNQFPFCHFTDNKICEVCALSEVWSHLKTITLSDPASSCSSSQLISCKVEPVVL